MGDLQFIPHTKRRKMTKARATKIFLAKNGICVNCGQQIRQGEPWFIEHPHSLAQGGSDNDDDLAPAHERCKPEKDARDAKSKAKRDRIVTASYAPSRKPKMQSHGFQKAPPQRSATRPIQKRMNAEPERPVE